MSYGVERATGRVVGRSSPFPVEWGTVPSDTEQRHKWIRLHAEREKSRRAAAGPHALDPAIAAQHRRRLLDLRRTGA